MVVMEGMGPMRRAQVAPSRAVEAVALSDSSARCKVEKAVMAW
jgi:hypothetical protein